MSWCGKAFERVGYRVTPRRMASVKEESCDPSGLGLCSDCTHARRIRSDRASTFLQCLLSFTDQRFEKYPRLPVLNCSGYRKLEGAPPRP